MIMETVPARFDGRDCWVMWHKINDEIIPAINKLLTNTPPNEPLTLDEMWEMDGEPVYLIIKDGYEPLEMWALIEVDETKECVILTNNLGGRSKYYSQEELYDEGITVYHRPLEEEENT